MGSLVPWFIRSVVHVTLCHVVAIPATICSVFDAPNTFSSSLQTNWLVSYRLQSPAPSQGPPIRKSSTWLMRTPCSILLQEPSCVVHRRPLPVAFSQSSMKSKIPLSWCIRKSKHASHDFATAIIWKRKTWKARSTRHIA